MTVQSRKAVGDPATRGQLIAEAKRIVETEGYRALTMGRLASEVGLTRPGVHYYFRTIDDLLVEIIRKQTEEITRDTRAQFASGNPLRTMWESRANANALTSEFIALGFSNEKIREEMSHAFDSMTQIWIEAVETFARNNDMALPAPAPVIATIFGGATYALAIGKAFGQQTGRMETVREIEKWLDQLDQQASPNQ